MIRAIRRQLRRIEYYSATRRRTVWTRAVDYGLLLSFVLALPAVWTCDRSISSAVDKEQITGHLGAYANGTVGALIGQDAERRLGWPGDRPLGEFTITVARHGAGWPFTTSMRTRPPILDLNLFDAPNRRRDVRLGSDDPRRQAIEAALATSGRTDLVELWHRGETVDDRYTFNWIAGSLIWTVLLMIATIVLVPTVRLATHVVWAKRASRRAGRKQEGFCPECGYDLQGLEFTERCPECGAIQR